MATLNVDELLGVMDGVLKTTLGKGVKEMMKEEINEAEVATELDALAEQITQNIVAQPPAKNVFMLLEPLSLTVKRANKSGDGYSKRAHTGGEEFRPLRCYAGKRGTLIYVFAPLAAADYMEMEMTESQAKKALSGFETWLKTVVDPELERARREAQEAASIAAEREKLAGRTEYQELGFGSW